MVDLKSGLADWSPESTERSEIPGLVVGLQANAIRIRRRWIVGTTLAAVDTLAAILAVAATNALAGAFFSRAGASEAPTFAALVTPAVFLASGLYSGIGPCPAERLRLRARAVCLCVGAAVVTSLSVSDGRPLPSMFSTLATGLFLVVLGHYGEALARGGLISSGLWAAPTLVLGSGPESKKLAESLLANPEWGLRPVCHIESLCEGKVSRGLSEITAQNDTQRSSQIEVVLLVTLPATALEDSLLLHLHPGLRVMAVQQVHKQQSLWLQTRALGDAVAVETRRDLYSPRKRVLKRVLDCLVAVPAAFVATPIILLLALAIKCVDPGSAFCRQTRVGLNGRPIRVIKIRTMYADAESRLAKHLAQDPAALAEWRRYYKLTNDPRILPVIGYFIRRSSLDELPQLFSVISGKMSLVGPRPFPEYHMEAFEPEFRTLRTSVPPGLTGLWQVSARSNGDLVVQQALDTFYIRNWSFWLDFYILLQTVVVVLGAKGAK
jgi:Undecaprenyl-phosphate galactose phosphotransferase WbaP